MFKIVIFVDYISKDSWFYSSWCFIYPWTLPIALVPGILHISKDSASRVQDQEMRFIIFQGLSKKKQKKHTHTCNCLMRIAVNLTEFQEMLSLEKYTFLEYAGD